MLSIYLTYIEDTDDKALFEEIYLAYRKQMLYLALSILGHQQDAEDAVSAVFLRIAERNWNTVRNIQNPTDLRNYLLKSTKNTCLNMLKKQEKEQITIEAVSLDNAPEPSDGDFLESICSRADTAAVLEAINKLDKKYRDVIYYHFAVGLGVRQTAQLVNRSVPTTKKQLIRGKKLLLKLLEAEGVVPYGDI